MNGTLDIPANGTVYTVTVGNGGAKGDSGSSYDGYNGGDSSFGDDVVATGGGGGGTWYRKGHNGGSGGGGGYNYKPG